MILFRKISVVCSFSLLCSGALSLQVFADDSDTVTVTGYTSTPDQGLINQSQQSGGGGNYGGYGSQGMNQAMAAKAAAACAGSKAGHAAQESACEAAASTVKAQQTNICFNNYGQATGNSYQNCTDNVKTSYDDAVTQCKNTQIQQDNTLVQNGTCPAK